MQFSVLLPTRNRPQLFEAALRSVLRQQGGGFEVVVVDDGTSGEHLAAMDALRTRIGETDGDRVRFITLPPSERGSGHSHALNLAARHAEGQYVCFLDDDDEWTDPGYLACAASVISHAEAPPDLLFFDQAAYDHRGRVGGPVWIEDLGPRLAAVAPDRDGAHTVSVAQLLGAHGFCHVNTTVVRRTVFEALGGFDEAIRYEEDRDFYLRAIDRAALIKYVPRTVSRHNVPDPAARSSFSAQSSELQKRASQVAVLDKAVRRSRNPEIVRHAQQHKVYALQRAAQAAFALGEVGEARRYVAQGLRSSFGPKWLAFAALLWSRAVVRSVMGRWSRAVL